MSDSDLWRDRAEGFRTLNDPHGMLRADWEIISKPPDILVSSDWMIRSAPNRSVQLEFEALAIRAGAALDDTTGDPLIAWLEALKADVKYSPRNDYRVYQELDSSGVFVANHQHGTVRNLAGVSADLCKVLENRALKEEFQKQQEDDPRNWSPLRAQWETFKGIKELHAGLQEEIPEAFVRSVLAQQYGIKPDEVTWEQIRFDVARLLPRYQNITVIPSRPVGDAAPQTDPKTDRQPVPASGAATENPPFLQGENQNTDTVAAERTALLDAYKREGKEHGIRITDEMVAKAASSKWNERTPVQRWKRDDPRCTPGDDIKIRSVLKKKPHLSPPR